MPPTLSPGDHFFDNWKDLLTTSLAHYGLCLPSSCSDADVREAMRELTRELSDDSNVYLFYVAACNSKDEPKPDYTATDIAML